MRKQAWRWLTFSLALLPLFYNCGRSDISEQSGSLQFSSEAPPAVKVAIDSLSLVHAPELAKARRANSRASKGDDWAVAAGTPLTAVIDKACLQRAQAGTLSARAVANSRTHHIEELGTQAYSFSLTQPSLVSELVEAAEADGCLVQLANDVVASVGPPSPRAPVANARMATNDPEFAQAKHLSAVHAPEAWNTFFSPGRGINKDVLVGIVDTGVDYTHPDLAANMWTAADGTHGTDLVNNDTDPMDDNEHGTHVAGLIGAVANNNTGVVGIMGTHIKLMAVKALGADGSGNGTNIINGIRWAADHGAEVINLSVELSGPSDAVKQAIIYAAGKGAVVVAAAGNSNKEITATIQVAPACYAVNIPGEISVASTDTVNGDVSSFSNFSSTFVTMSAPGSEDSVTNQGLISTVPGNKYKRLEGTSMATPIVVGSAALAIGIMKSNGVDKINNAAVASLLMTTAAPRDSLKTKVVNGNALDLDRLARLMKSRYLIEDDGGTESPF